MKEKVNRAMISLENKRGRSHYEKDNNKQIFDRGGGESNHNRITSRLKGAIKEILGDRTSLFLLGIFLLVSIVSIGYSALSSSLMVTGEANFRVREDVRITGIKVLSFENEGYETYSAEYYKDGTKVMVTLPKTDSKVTYEVEITNSTSFDYYLKSKSDVPSTNTQMKYEIQDLEIDKTTIPKNSTMKFKIVISYQDGTSEVPSNNTVIFETRYVFDILDVTPPTVSFSPMGGSYQEFQKVTITASDEHYDHMDLEVRDGSNEKIEEKSQTDIKATTFEVSLDNYDTYKILVKAYDQIGNTQTDTPLENGYTYQEYVIRKQGGNAAEQLKEKTNPSELTYTDSTEEQKRQMYAFQHEATEQTGVLTDYRYLGNDPYNYVYFNCTDDSDTSTCETWRIIGVFPVDDGHGNIEERMKIIRDTSIGYMKWDSGDVNNWERASLNTYLNGSYYNGLSSTAKTMIGNTKYYLGGSSEYENLGGPDYYKFERENTVYGSNPTSWVGKIALMYPSDYVYTYALGVNDKCYTDASHCYQGSPISGWLFNSNSQWTLFTRKGVAGAAFYVGFDGGVSYAYSPGVASSIPVRPTLYLASSVLIVDGDGSSGDPYQLDISPIISFNYLSGTYGKPRTITITSDDTNYSHMNVEVRNHNGRVESKSRNNITENTYTVTLEEEGTYTVSVMAYDEDGYVTQAEQQYVIRKPVAVDKLKDKTNSDTVTSYANGNKQEMFTFQHYATSQTGTLTDYRYIGDKPYNYVYFNCKEEPQNSTNCETWRIIGIFSVDDGTGKIEERVKIIKDTSIGDMAWDEKSDKNWKAASLNTYLNGSYLSGLSETAQAMIGDTKFYLGGSDTRQNLGGPDYYDFERGNAVYGSYPTYWPGKIALMYPSDYVYTYALGVNNKCYTAAFNCDQGSPSSGWLYKNKTEWTLSPDPSGGAGRAFYVSFSGSVDNYSGYFVTDTSGVRPALYLVSSVSIVDGDGSSGNPYQLAI